jgi:hypothetical protein
MKEKRIKEREIREQIKKHNDESKKEMTRKPTKMM